MATQTNNAIFDPEHVGMRCEINFAKSLQLKVKELLKYHQDGFPGAQPISFDRSHLNLLATEDYYVCEKSDGVRYLMYATHTKDGPSTFLINRDNCYQYLNTIALPTRENINKYQHESLLDGELVIDTNKETKKKTARFLVFDLMVLNSTVVTQRSFSTRLGMLQQDIIQPLENLISTNPEIAKKHPFKIELKKMERSYGLKLVLAALPFLNHPSDGLIFTSVRLPYRGGVSNKLLKWKPPELNTVDFRIAVSFNSDRKPVYQLQVASGQGLKAFSPLQLSPQLYASWRPSPPEGKIAEFKWDPEWLVTTFETGYASTTVKGGWVFVKFRTDKKAPNDENTVRRMIRSIEDGVSREMLEGAIDHIRSQWKEREKNYLRQSTTRSDVTSNETLPTGTQRKDSSNKLIHIDTTGTQIGDQGAQPKLSPNKVLSPTQANLIATESVLEATSVANQFQPEKMKNGCDQEKQIPKTLEEKPKENAELEQNPKDEDDKGLETEDQKGAKEEFKIATEQYEKSQKNIQPKIPDKVALDIDNRLPKNSIFHENAKRSSSVPSINFTNGRQSRRLHSESNLPLTQIVQIEQLKKGSPLKSTFDLVPSSEFDHPKNSSAVPFDAFSESTHTKAKIPQVSPSLEAKIEPLPESQRETVKVEKLDLFSSNNKETKEKTQPPTASDTKPSSVSESILLSVPALEPLLQNNNVLRPTVGSAPLLNQYVSRTSNQGDYFQSEINLKQSINSAPTLNHQKTTNTINQRDYFQGSKMSPSILDMSSSAPNPPKRTSSLFHLMDSNQNEDNTSPVLGKQETTFRELSSQPPPAKIPRASKRLHFDTKVTAIPAQSFGGASHNSSANLSSLLNDSTQDTTYEKPNSYVGHQILTSQSFTPSLAPASRPHPSALGMAGDPRSTGAPTTQDRQSKSSQTTPNMSHLDMMRYETSSYSVNQRPPPEHGALGQPNPGGNGYGPRPPFISPRGRPVFTQASPASQHNPQFNMTQAPATYLTSPPKGSIPLDVTYALPQRMDPPSMNYLQAMSNQEHLLRRGSSGMPLYGQYSQVSSAEPPSQTAVNMAYALQQSLRRASFTQGRPPQGHPVGYVQSGDPARIYPVAYIRPHHSPHMSHPMASHPQQHQQLQPQAYVTPQQPYAHPQPGIMYHHSQAGSPQLGQSQPKQTFSVPSTSSNPPPQPPAPESKPRQSKGMLDFIMNP